MGLFDYISYSCPNCNKTIKEQSKAGDCLMNSYSLVDAPASIIGSISGYTQICYHCEKTYHVKSKIMVDVEICKGEYSDDDSIRKD